MWLSGELDEEEVVLKRGGIAALLDRIELLPLSPQVLTLAAEPFPTHINTLDAIHLATAILHRRSPAAQDEQFVFATHDRALAKAPAAMHFEVIGA